MVTAPAVLPRRAVALPTLLPHLVAGAVFVALFRDAFATLLRDWWDDPDAAHGLLLAPLAVWMAWRRGVVADARPRPGWAAVGLSGAVLLRWASELAAELFTLRMSLLLALAALVVGAWGFRQLLRWWLPWTLLLLSVPLPDVLVSTLTLPLQLRASALGAALLEWRHVPVRLAGNVIHMPGQALFVTEACSGLRSLSALLAIGLLAGAMWLARPATRALLLLVTVPVAVLLNGVRVFLTGFMVHYISPSAGQGFLHWTEGWVMFVVAFAVLMGAARLLELAERRVVRR